MSSDQRFAGAKYKKDGTATYDLRLAHVQNIVEFLRTLNLYELDQVQVALTDCRNNFLKDEEKLRGKENGSQAKTI